jgi:chromosome segregation ATPase
VIETAIYFSAGFLSAALLGILFVPLLYRRAMRRALRRIVSAAPYPPAEIRADKDELRAKLATSTRQLEKSLAAMKTKTMSKLNELGQKTDMIAQLQNEIGEKTDAITRLKNEVNEKAATISTLEERNIVLGERLRAAQTQFENRGGALCEAEELLVRKEAELIRLSAELKERSFVAERHSEEILALHEQVEAIRTSVVNYENALNARVPLSVQDDEEDFNSLELHGGGDRLGPPRYR